MAKETKAQRETVERVMCEWKEGKLETSRGTPVKSQRQAVAIALHEADASRDETPAKNHKNLAVTKARERKSEETRASLYEGGDKNVHTPSGVRLSARFVQWARGHGERPAMAEVAPEQRILRITASADASQVSVSVIDNGHGIAPDVAERLFSPFFSTKAEGMGMGLSICRTAIEFHGGTLTHAPNPGGGTVFTFSLPRQDAVAELQ